MIWSRWYEGHDFRGRRLRGKFFDGSNARFESDQFSNDFSIHCHIHLVDLLQIFHLSDGQLRVHFVGEVTFFYQQLVVDPKHILQHFNNVPDETKRWYDHTVSQEEPQNDETVLVSNVLTDFANHLVSEEISSQNVLYSI